MNNVFRVLGFLGLLGFVLSVAVHVCGLLQYPAPLGGWVWALHVGIFPLFFPLVYYANKTKPSKAGRDNLSHLMKEVPESVRGISKWILGYAVVNFVVFLFQTSLYPKRGVPEWLEQRGFSGHWMVFYGITCLGFWGLYRLGLKNETREC